jgi:hypothetical protein
VFEQELLCQRIHIYFLIGFANRLLVMLQWVISFITKRRGVRILPSTQAAKPQAQPRLEGSQVLEARVGNENRQSRAGNVEASPPALASTHLT